MLDVHNMDEKKFSIKKFKRRIIECRSRVKEGVWN